MRNYFVEYRVASSEIWLLVQNGTCGDMGSMSNVCQGGCVAEALPSNSKISFRVYPRCVNSVGEPLQQLAGNSDFVSTLVEQVRPPVNLAMQQMSSSELRLSWSANYSMLSSDCVFSQWDITLFLDDNPAIVTTNPVGCQNLRIFNSTSCVAKGLLCNTAYRFYVQLSCSSPTANAPPSNASAVAVATLNNASCLQRAKLFTTSVDSTGSPTVQLTVDSSSSSQKLIASWANVGYQLFNCTFWRYSIQILSIDPRGNIGNRWDACQVYALSVRSCTIEDAARVQSNYSYQGQVQIQCSNTPLANSDPTVWSEFVKTKPLTAIAPTSVIATRPSSLLGISPTDALVISWSGYRLGDWYVFA